MSTSSDNSTSDSQCAIMFADIAGSTRLYNQLGDKRAESLISRRLATMRNITSNHNGRVVKTIGDEIMCQFPTAVQATFAAKEMHIDKATDNETEALDIRIGMHFGNTIEKHGDIYGDAVNIAARMAAIAKTNQIITTENFIHLLNKDLANNTRLFDNVRVKGIDKEIKIYQILWEEDNVTTYATTQHIDQILQPRMSIVFKFDTGERFYNADDITTPVSIGRDGSCDITIDSKYASRSHVNLEFRRGKFVLVDHSTNGTYVKFKHQNEVFIRREEIPLMGEGYISLGENYKKKNTTNIYYSVFQKS